MNKVIADRRSLAEKLQDLSWGGKDWRDYKGEGSIGIAKTQITNPANIGGGGGGGVSNLAQIPSQIMFLAAKDSTASGLNIDVTFTQTVNPVSNISAFPGLVLSGTDEFYTQLATSAGGLSQVSGWIYACNGTRGNTTSGPRFGAIKSFTSRAVPKPTSVLPVGCDPGYFIGLAKNFGNAIGINTSLGTITGAQTDTGWRQNNVDIPYAGFYYRRVQSANWLLATGDGAGNASLIDSGVTVDNVNTATLDFTYDGTTLKFYINSNIVGSINSNKPGNSKPMCIFVGIAMMTATSSTTQLVWGFSYGAAGYK